MSKHEKDISVADQLAIEFRNSLETVAKDPIAKQRMIALLKEYNPSYVSKVYDSKEAVADVLANVVAAVYAPLIHSFTLTMLKNVAEGKLPPVAIAPPRDAIPLANSIREMSKLHGVPIRVLEPTINRRVAGIENNQLNEQIPKSPLFGKLIDQVHAQVGSSAVFELETGIYGTTSILAAAELKKRGLEKFIPIKFYGLGPNISFVHAILSGGKEWVAEKAEAKGLVNKRDIERLMILLDSMEELGMENFYASPNELTIGAGGQVVPIKTPPTKKENEQEVDPLALPIARATNAAIVDTAKTYSQITADQTGQLLRRLPDLIRLSQKGLPLTYTGAIPSMDNRDQHYANIRRSGLFDYPQLSIVESLR